MLEKLNHKKPKLYDNLTETNFVLYIVIKNTILLLKLDQQTLYFILNIVIRIFRIIIISNYYFTTS